MKPIMFILVSLICVSCAGTREKMLKADRNMAGTPVAGQIQTPTINTSFGR